ncbi:hypothetical protein [Tepidibacter hydrothermalis]|uniref:Uncharacterized protein n=1 Tax=Tepidibacter hydrothermalis TaxID=3036126 RepID=A0ABY8E9W6_9FIRM|nr:hypothetical protein [Tepidibacter hydrothermalis]WFD08725.1 hypothetical protein P4S50_09980 [Tepidibacter hydrothermalis]
MEDYMKVIIEPLGRVGNEMKGRLISDLALVDILIEKKIITKEEYNNKVNELSAKLGDKINDYLLNGNVEELNKAIKER